MSEAETYSNKGAVCPHCGHVNDPADDNYSLFSEETCEWECGCCDREFNVSVYISYSWKCTAKEGCDDDSAERKGPTDAS